MMKLYALPGDDVRGLPLVVDVALLLAEVGRLEEAEPLLPKPWRRVDTSSEMRA